jgi:hypothetical protein
MSDTDDEDRRELKVELNDPMRSSSGFKNIDVFCDGELRIQISLHRTLHIPSNDDVDKLPPYCGQFSGHSTSRFFVAVYISLITFMPVAVCA